MNIVTKSGTNKFHGSVFEFVRNGAVNAQNAFSTTPDTLKRNQFGFAAGGPIIKNKLFVFGSYQQTLIRAQNLINDYVGLATATENNQKGQFKSAITGDIVQVPVSTVATNLFKYIPGPNYTPPGGQLTNYNSTTPNKTNDPQGVVKVDYTIGGHRLFARYFTDRLSIAANPLGKSTLTSSGFNALAATQGQAGMWDAYALGDTWAFKSWVVDGRASYIKAHTAGGSDNSLAALDITGLGATGVSVGKHPTLPTFYALGGLFASGGGFIDNKTTSYDYSVDVLHTAGKHEVGFGTDFRFIGLDQVDQGAQNPAFVFVGLHTLFLGPGPLDNNAFADLDEGYPYESQQGDGSFFIRYGSSIWLIRAG